LQSDNINSNFADLKMPTKQWKLQWILILNQKNIIM